MLGLAFLFLIIAVVAYFLGAGRAGDMAVNIAKICFVVFLVFLIISVLMALIAPAPYWGWPVYHSGPRLPY